MQKLYRLKKGTRRVVTLVGNRKDGGEFIFLVIEATIHRLYLLVEKLNFACIRE